MLRSIVWRGGRATVPPLVVAVLFLASCDFLGLGGALLDQPEFQVSDGLAERITVLNEAREPTGGRAKQGDAAVSLTPVVQVRAPSIGGTVTQTSHVSHNAASGRLYVGYKLGGDPFGGAIDVLELRDGGRVGAVRSLESGNVDVVEVRHDADDEALFMAGAVNTRKLGGNPALVAKATPRQGGVDLKSKRLDHFVGKGLILGPEPNTVHVVTDENAVYQFDRELQQQAKLTAKDAAGFRSVAAHDSQVFVLDRSGTVFSEAAASFSELSESASLTNRSFNERAIARLLAADGRLFAALNIEGFGILSPDGEAIWTSGRSGVGALYTCIALGPNHLFVGRRDGAIEVYERPAGVPAPDADFEPAQVIRLWRGDASLDLPSESINQLLMVDGHLYVAYSSEGLLVFRVGT